MDPVTRAHKPPASNDHQCDQVLTAAVRCERTKIMWKPSPSLEITLATYGKAIMNECAHMECIRLDLSVGRMLRDQLGAPYESKPDLARWSGVWTIPTMVGDARVPFELVICQRGASIRCHWSHVQTVNGLIERMAPALMGVMVMGMPTQG